MPEFKYTFSRTWTETDELIRIIIADNEDAADAIAAQACADFNQDCPDDVTSYKSGEAGPWGVEDMDDDPDSTDDVPYYPDDSDLEEAAEGDVCAACDRASIDCSREPCEAVQADREA